MLLDAIIVADAEVESFSGTHGLKLTIGARVADIQTVKHFVAHQGRLQPPIEGDGRSSWASTPKLKWVLRKLLHNGINCSCYLIFGFPGETQTSADHTIAFMKRFNDVAGGGTIAWSIFPFIAAPLSPIYEPSMRTRYRLEGCLRQWRHATMDAKLAMAHVRQAFLSIESSGANYRSDNQACLAQLSAPQRHAFHRTRQRLAK